MRIIKVLPNDKVMVQFQDEFTCTKEIHWNNFKSGNAMNQYDRKNGGVGYIGEGKYKTKYNGRNTKIHNTWNDMLARCYKEQSRFKYSSYIDCEVCEEWHNFQNFAKWYEVNYYKVGNERMHLDKDILVKGNRLYSPETCLIVPQKINMIFMTKEKGVDADLPNAIKRSVKGYRSSYNGKSLGNFKTLEEAINEHDRIKKIHIKEIAEEYKNKIPTKVYDALLNW